MRLSAATKICIFCGVRVMGTVTGPHCFCAFVCMFCVVSSFFVCRVLPTPSGEGTSNLLCNIECNSVRIHFRVVH